MYVNTNLSLVVCDEVIHYCPSFLFVSVVGTTHFPAELLFVFQGSDLPCMGEKATNWPDIRCFRCIPSRPRLVIGRRQAPETDSPSMMTIIQWPSKAWLVLNPRQTITVAVDRDAVGTNNVIVSRLHCRVGSGLTQAYLEKPVNLSIFLI